MPRTTHGPQHLQISDVIAELATGPVFYRDSGGDGVPVVFLHAASGHSAIWECQIPAVTEAGYRFIAIDYRGVGRKAGSGDWSDQIEALVVHLGVEPFHLLGTAAGGGAAFQYTLAYPHRVRSLIVANSHGNVTDKDYVDLGHRIRPAPQFDALPLDFRELGPSYRAEHPEGVARWLELSRSRPVADGRKNEGAAAPQQSFELHPERKVTWAKLEALRVPTLLIAGDADLYMPPSVLRMFLSHMKHAESAVIPETGHSSYWESPELFNRTVLDFIQRH
jgi:pimeloyl-ACP methyl ester carboxylesterase